MAKDGDDPILLAREFRNDVVDGKFALDRIGDKVVGFNLLGVEVVFSKMIQNIVLSFL